jgi:hypothetical protein
MHCLRREGIKGFRASTALDYGLDIKQEVTPRFFLLRTIDKGAKDLINTVKQLNNDERIVKASFTFKRCN